MKTLTTILLCFISLGVFAQVQIDKSIELTGNGSDAKITGIQEVLNDEDGTNKIYVDTAIANRAGGGSVSIASISCDTVYMTDNTFFVIPGVLFAFADAGDSQYGLMGGTAAQLAARPPHYGTGTWQVVTGSGGSFANVNDPNTSFSGNPSTTYELDWVVSTPCGNDTDRVTIEFGIIPPKRIFITSTSYTGQLGGLSGADSKCQARANAAGLGGTWTAWLSSTTVNARDRVTQSAGRYERIDGIKIADNWTDLTDGNLDNTLSVDEFGSGSGGAAWTNTRANGTKILTQLSETCQDWTATSGQTLTGSANYTQYWTWNAWQNCSTNNRLYCFED